MPRSKYADTGDVAAREFFDLQERREHKSGSKNRERAYVGASRRLGRTIEARLQSAHMASAVHKERTGKALRISAAIVESGEYEEEAEAFSRGYRFLRPQPLADVNRCGNRSTFSSQLGGETNQHEDEINLAFVHFFPHAQLQAHFIRKWHMVLDGQIPATTDFDSAAQTSGTGDNHQVSGSGRKDTLSSTASSESDSPLPVSSPESESSGEMPHLQQPLTRKNSAPLFSDNCGYDEHKTFADLLSDNEMAIIDTGQFDMDPVLCDWQMLSADSWDNNTDLFATGVRITNGPKFSNGRYTGTPVSGELDPNLDWNVKMDHVS